MANSPSRMLKLLSLLQTRRDWPGRVLSERLDVSERTVRRDIDHLRELGYQIRAVKGPDGGYRLDAGSQLPPLLFDDDQAVAVAVSLQTAAATGAANAEAALRALTTVRQVMPSRLRHKIDALAFTTMRNPTVPEVQPEVLVAVNAAVQAHEVLRFDYSHVGSTGVSRKRVEPHHLVFSSGRWYLIAWEPDRERWRVFRVDRMRPSTPTGPRFTPRALPGADPAEFLAAKFRGAVTGSDWPCVGEAVLALPARRVTPFAGDGVVEELASNRCRLTIGAWSWVAVAAMMARFDAPMTEVAPAELVDAFALLSQRFGDIGEQRSG